MNFVLTFSLLILTSCVHMTPSHHDFSGFLKQDIKTSFFKLRSYLKINNTNLVRVYIEGDGRAWASRYKPSLNPTPKDPIAFHLAALDPSSSVIYLARPCQYNIKNCPQKYWTSHRFANEVIESFDQALDQLKKEYSIKRFELVGFSGGAAIATLLAAKRNDISGIRTIAGNLNHELVSQNHSVSSLNGSLNPIDIAKKISSIPQHHFVGENDKTLSKGILQSFLNASGDTTCINFSSVPGATHYKPWVKIWPKLLNAPLSCKAQKKD